MDRIQRTHEVAEEAAGEEVLAVDYKESLLSDLRSLAYCARYLSFSIRESLETFLLALRNVVEAQTGMKKLATEAGVNRENLYKMLSEEGNPRLNTLEAILKALGLRLIVEPISPTVLVSSPANISTLLRPPGVRASAGPFSQPKLSTLETLVTGQYQSQENQLRAYAGR